jgi:hypothetical protein
MSTEEIIIVIVRVLGSLPVLFWPFPGAIIAIASDASDVFIMSLLDLGGVSDYHRFDKALDQIYMVTFLIVALRWPPRLRNISIALFVYRLTGVVVFEATGERDALWLAPNLFDFWFVLVAGIRFFGLDAREDDERTPWMGGLFPFKGSVGQLGVALLAVTAAKAPVEYVLHTKEWFDRFTAMEAVEWIWRFLTPPY